MAVKQVQFQKKNLTISKRDDKSVTLTGLVAAGATAVAKTQDIDLITDAPKPTTIKLEVVNSKIETVTK
jgi:hypothetical protein